MHSQENIFLWTVIVAIVGVIILAYNQMRRYRYNHPPGPMQIPFLGHSYIIQGLNQAEFVQWLSKQGPLVRLVLNGKNWIGVNSLEAASTLMLKNGNNCSSRPFLPLLSDVIFRDSGFAFMQYGDKWRRHRRLIHSLVNPAVVYDMKHMLTEEVHNMLRNIGEATKSTDIINITEYLCDYAFAVAIRLMFGRIPTARRDDVKPFEFFRKLAHDTFMFATPPPFDFWKLIPFGPKYSKVQLQRTTEIQRRLDQFIGIYLDEVRKQIKDGTAENSIAKKYLVASSKGEDFGLNFEEFNGFLINILLAGVETVGDNLAWATAAITKHPQHQQVAHQQLAQLGRFPTSNDCQQLFYIQNVIKESLRMYPSNVLNLPRENIEHCQYQGYDIPARSTIVLNLYAMNRDPKRFPNPGKFNPSRFGTHTDRPEINPFPFGMGRRTCPGLHLAKAEMFNALAGLLYTYQIIEHPNHPFELTTNGHSMSNPPAPFKVQLRKLQI